MLAKVAVFKSQEVEHAIQSDGIDALFGISHHTGNTVWLIEHNLDVIRSADWLVELGPGAGEDGGRVLYAGLPAGVRACPESVTKDYL